MRLLRAERKIEPSLLGQFELTSKKYTVLRSLISLLRNTLYHTHMRFPADFSALPCRKQNTIFFLFSHQTQNVIRSIRFHLISESFVRLSDDCLTSTRNKLHGFHAEAKNCLILSGLFDGLDDSNVGKNILSSDIFSRKQASKEDLSLFLHTAFIEWQLMIKRRAEIRIDRCIEMNIHKGGK